MQTESKEDRLVRLFREKVEQMSQEELERKLSELEDGSADEENSGVVSFDCTIKGTASSDSIWNCLKVTGLLGMIMSKSS